MQERTITCTKCKTVPTQVGRFWICPEHGPIEPEKPSAPLRIFLSYGHDQNEDLVLLIKADLEKRGHDVWFDKKEIKAGDNWRRSITDGIASSGRVLSFLSKHSTRDPGVCLDEVAIAIGFKGGNIQTILVESEAEVSPPPSISHIQWLDMQDWRAMRSAGGQQWQDWYQAKLDEIVRVVESDESRRFAGEIETLSGYLQPISSDARISRLIGKGFVGRKWLADAVESWRVEKDRSSRVFWITGAPGVGKSAYAAHLTHYGKDKVIAAQFCEWDKLDHRDARRVVCSLAFQLATRLPEYRKLLLTLPEISKLGGKDAAELFAYLLVTPLGTAIGGGRQRCLIVIDALDEAGDGERNPLVEMLARNAPRLPDWLGLVFTSRPESSVMGPLQGLKPVVLDTGTKANRDDIRKYLNLTLAAQLNDVPDAAAVVEKILDKSEGVFLYTDRFVDEVLQGHLSLDRPEQFPQGLGGIYFEYFQRQFPDLERFKKDVRPALRAILAAREPLPLEILQRLRNWGDEELRDFTRSLSSLFPETRDRGLAAVKAYHKSLSDWLTDETKAGVHFVSVREGHQMLADWGWREFSEQPRGMTPYSLSHLAHHLIAARDKPRFLSLVADRWFWERSPVFCREQFYAEVAGLLPADEAVRALGPVHDFYANQAAARSPATLGYTLFPHEPGVNFDGGTQCDGYMIPRGAIEPPYEALYDFIESCRRVYESSAAFLRGGRSPAIAAWYRDYWRGSRLQRPLDQIASYYGFDGSSVSYRAGDLSSMIDRALDEHIPDTGLTA